MTDNKKSTQLTKEMNHFYFSHNDIYKETEADINFRESIFRSVQDNSTDNIKNISSCTYLESFFTIIIKISYKEKSFTYHSTHGDTSLKSIIHSFNNCLEVDFYRDKNFDIHITSILYPPRSISLDKISSQVKGSFHFEPGIDGIMLKNDEQRYYITTNETLSNDINTASGLKKHLNQKFGSSFISKCNIFLFRSKDYLLTSNKTLEIFYGRFQCSSFSKNEIINHTLSILSSFFERHQNLSNLAPIFYDTIDGNKKTLPSPKKPSEQLNQLYIFDSIFYTIYLSILCKKNTNNYKAEVNYSLEKIISDNPKARDWDPLAIIGLLTISSTLSNSTLALLDSLVFEKIAQDSNKNITQPLIELLQERELGSTRKHAIKALIASSLSRHLTRPIDFNRAPYKNWVGKVKSNNDYIPRRSSRAMLTNMHNWMLQDKYSDISLSNIVLFLWSELAYNKPYCKSSIFNNQETYNMNIKNITPYIAFFIYACGVLQDEI